MGKLGTVSEELNRVFQEPDTVRGTLIFANLRSYLASVSISEDQCSSKNRRAIPKRLPTSVEGRENSAVAHASEVGVNLGVDLILDEAE